LGLVNLKGNALARGEIWRLGGLFGTGPALGSSCGDGGVMVVCRSVCLRASCSKRIASE